MITFSSVSKIYNNIVALDDVSFEIDKDEFVFLVGPSGSGKTTIIKMLIKEEEPTSGEIFFYETDITKIKGEKITQLRREIGVVFQDFKLLPHKSLYENVAFALEVSGKQNEDIEKTVKYVLELIGLEDRANAFPDEISGGEKQKVAIARAIANNPKVLIADEPTGNLDPESSWDIINLLLKINEWGTTVIMATHGSDLVNKVGKRVIQMEKGKIISDTRTGTYPTTSREEQPKEEIQIDFEKIQHKTKHETKRKKEKKKKIVIPETEDKEVEEREFEITFTTKQKVPLKSPVKKKKSKKKKDSKVDLKQKKKLPSKITDLGIDKKAERSLEKGGYTSINQLKKLTKSQLKKIRGIGTKDATKIVTQLKKSD